MLDTKSKNSKKFSLFAVLIIMAAAALFLSMYGIFERKAQRYKKDLFINEETITQLVQSNYVLYRDLLEKSRQEQYSYKELYLDIKEEEIDDSREYDATSYEGEYFEGNIEAAVGEQADFLESHINEYRFQLYEGIGQEIDYCAIDNKTGRMIKNTGRGIEKEETPGLEENPYAFYVKMVYDGAGKATVSVHSKDADKLLKIVKSMVEAQKLSLDGYTDTKVYYNGWENHYGTKYTVSTKEPSDVTFIYAMTQAQQKAIMNNGNSALGQQSVYAQMDAYYKAGIHGVYWLFLAALALAALLLPCLKRYGFQEFGAARLPLEISWIAGSSVFGGGEQAVTGMVCRTFNGDYYNMFKGMTPSYMDGSGINLMVSGWNFLCTAALFMIWYICITSLVQIKTDGWRAYFRNSFTYMLWSGMKGALRRTGSFLKKKWQGFERQMLTADIGKDVSNHILKIVLINLLILLIICTLWFFGIPVLIIYSVILFFAIRKYMEKIQNQYSALLRATDSIAEGNLNTQFGEDLGVFEAYRTKLDKIQEGFRKAVDEEVKSQKMKTELITNVSHDLKTPLTAIITYIDLLKGENVTEEQKKEYLNTLECKSLRLKVLIEDLFEVSKADSRNVTLNLVQVDLVNLMRQVYLEHADKTEEAGLDFRFRFPEERILLELDSQKTYRIFENLYVNIIKYTMPHTRVYVDVVSVEGSVTVEMKNISRTELNINPDELTERFVRGDSSRNTEGSGLGLAIAKSFVELQGGAMSVGIDGDLFKVRIVWKSL